MTQSKEKKKMPWLADIATPPHPLSTGCQPCRTVWLLKEPLRRRHEGGVSLQQLHSSLDLCVDFRHTKTARRCHCRTPRGHGSHSGSGPQAIAGTHADSVEVELPGAIADTQGSGPQADVGTHADGVVPPQLNNIGLAGGGALGKAAP